MWERKNLTAFSVTCQASGQKHRSIVHQSST